MKLIFRSTGIYLGFIFNGSLFSRDGDYWGWVEDDFVWDAKGRFRGALFQDKYIILNKFAVPPIPRIPRVPAITPTLPAPPVNISPIALPTGWADSF